MTEEIQTSASEEEVEDKELNIEDTKVAIIAALTEDNEFVFRLFGKEQTIINLMGVIEYARQKIQQEADQVIFKGDRVTHEVGKAVGLLNDKVEKLHQEVRKLLPPGDE